LIVEARALGALVDKADTKKNLTLDNKKITWSKGFLSGKSEMTVSTPLPVDKENSMPLAEVLFPKEINDFQEFHFFDDNITSAIDGILAEWEHAERLRVNGIQPSYSCLFFGEPGTGKTELAKHLAAKLNLP
jgi:ATP-dependent 26S proteasome regulatory subunit